MSGPGTPRAAFSAAAFAELRAAAGEGQGEALRLLLADIDEDPDQPRTVFDDEGLALLAESIRAHGVLQPVVVRPPVEGRYRLAFGARRLRAARLAGLADIPAVIRRAAPGDFAAQVIKNRQRADLANSDLAADGHISRQIAAICALKDYQVAAFRQVGNFPPELRARLDEADMRALYDLYRQWCRTPDAVIAALPEPGRPITVTKARRIVGAITGRPTGSLVLDRPAASRQRDSAPGPAEGGGLHGASRGGVAGADRHGANRPASAASAPSGMPVFHVALSDGRTGRLVVDRRAARHGAALVAFASGVEEVDATGLRIVRVD